MNAEIHELIRKAQSGDKDAFGQLYTHFYTPVYRYLLVRIRNRSDAEDLAADTFVKFFNAIPDFALTRQSPLPYLFTIARNTLIDQVRKKSHSSSIEDEELFAIPDLGPDAEEIASEGEDAELIRAVIPQLPPGERSAVTLRYFDGLSTKECAELLGKSEEAVRQLLSRGLRRMKKILESKP
jgi:RNA polymerase sigma-70 factor (ECF subfamily)